MINFVLEYYNWFKALHIIAIIAWVAGMLYLPRLFVYHAGAAPGSQLSETFKVMEYRLLRFIINPAMILALLFGALLLRANPELLAQEWMHWKMLAVVGMIVAHGLYAKWRKDFAKDKNKHTAKFYKVWNEVPTLLMIVIVVMVVVRPFS